MATSRADELVEDTVVWWKSNSYEISYGTILNLLSPFHSKESIFLSMSKSLKTRGKTHL